MSEGEDKGPGEGAETGTDGITERVAAILAADAVGYSRLMADDEAATVKALDKARDVFRRHVEANRGRVVDTAGDSVLAVFETTSGAVRASMAIQEGLHALNADTSTERQMQFRIGIHLGDIMEKPSDGTIYGDGVNVAARLEALSEPGRITVSSTVYDSIRDRLEVGFEFLGEHEGKNLKRPVKAYRVLAEGEEPEKPKSRSTVFRRTGIVTGLGAAAAILAGLTVWGLTIQVEAPQMLTADGTPTDDPLLAMPTGPSIAVLPFDNLSGDPEQAFFADGMAEYLINKLSRFPSYRVFSRNTTFQFRDSGTDVIGLAKELDAHFIVDGSVQRSAEEIRVNVQVVSGQTGKQVWGNSYDRDLSAASIFDIQDDVAEQIAGTIADTYGAISFSEYEAAKTQRTESLVAYQCVLLAHGYYGANLLPEEHSRVRDCLENAVQIDPDYADAWAWLAGMYRDEFSLEFNPRANALDRAEEAAARAVSIQPDNQQAHLVLTHVNLFKGRIPACLNEAEKTLSINPNSADVLASMGMVVAYAGEWARGLDLIRKAKTLNPRHPPWFDFPFAYDHFRRGEYAEGLVYAEATRIRGYHVSYLALSAYYAKLGRDAEASALIDELLEFYPDFNVAQAIGLHKKWNLGGPLLESMTDAWRMAGLPDSSDETPSRPVIAVLPFDNLSGDPEQEYFADGITEDIITRLSRSPDIGVIARNSSFQYKDENVDVRAIAQELGATHVLEGSVRRAENDIRIIAQFLDAGDGTSLWSEAYDRELSAGSIFEVQDDISERVVGVIASFDSVVALASVRASAAKPPSDLSSYECVMLASEYWRTITSDAHLRARTCLESVVSKDEEFARAWTLLGGISVDEFLYGYNSQPDLDPPLDRAVIYARRAVELDPQDAWAHYVLARVAFYRNELLKFRATGERALRLAPNDAAMLAMHGHYSAYSGDWVYGLGLMDRAVELNPNHQPWYHFPYFYNEYRQGNYDAALDAALKIGMPGFFWPHQVTAAAYAQLGMEEEAAEAITALLELWPGYSIQAMADIHRLWNFEEDVIERMADGLRKAGLPENTN